MAARIRAFFHNSSNTTPVASVGTAFDKAKAKVHDLRLNAPLALSVSPFYGRVEGITVQVAAIAGGATTLTVRLCLDSDCDVSIVPDVTATIAVGVTTATAGSIAVSVGLPYFQTSGGNLYLVAKTDTGTVTLGDTAINWSES